MTLNGHIIMPVMLLGEDEPRVKRQYMKAKRRYRKLMRKRRVARIWPYHPCRVDMVDTMANHTNKWKKYQPPALGESKAELDAKEQCKEIYLEQANSKMKH